MGAEAMDIPAENGHCRIMKKRKFAFNNDRDRSTGIMRGGGIRCRRYESKVSIWSGGIWERGIMYHTCQHMSTF